MRHTKKTQALYDIPYSAAMKSSESMQEEQSDALATARSQAGLSGLWYISHPNLWAKKPARRDILDMDILPSRNRWQVQAIEEHLQKKHEARIARRAFILARPIIAERDNREPIYSVDGKYMSFTEALEYAKYKNLIS
jgi:hypothetical protein